MAKGINDRRYVALLSQLVDRRKALGLTQQQLADRIGNIQRYVSKYETGERRLDVGEFIDIAQALGLDAGRMVSDAVDPIGR